MKGNRVISLFKIASVVFTIIWSIMLIESIKLGDIPFLAVFVVLLVGFVYGDYVLFIKDNRR